jgi:type I restriction enzyme S subunit
MSDGLSGWREYHLNEIYTFASGLSKSRDQFGFGFPFLSFKDVFNNFFLPKKLGNLANTSIKERLQCSIKKGDVFLTRTSETQEELGMSSVALIDYPEATFNGFTKRLRPIGHIDVWPEYTGYYFRSPYFRATVTSMSSMTTRASLNNDMMSALKIMVPPLPEQKAIANVLSSLDNKIDLLHRQNKTLESMAETLFRHWFIEEAHEGWIDTTLDCHSEVMRGLSYKGSGLSDSGFGIPMHNLNSVYEGGGYKEVGIKYYRDKFKERHLVRNGEIIVANTEQGHEFKLIGCPAIVPSFYGEKGLFSQHIYRVILKEKSYLTTEYLYYLLLTPSVREQIISATNGSTVNMLAIDGLQRPKFKLPPKEKVVEFSELVKSWWKKKDVNHLQIRTLEKLRDTLLPKLMSGEVTVIN